MSEFWIFSELNYCCFVDVYIKILYSITVIVIIYSEIFEYLGDIKKSET